MKKTLLLINLLLSIIAFAQQHLKIEYNQIFNTDRPLIRTAILQANETNSVFVDIMSTRRDLTDPKDAQKSYIEKQNVPQEAKDGQFFEIRIGGNFDKYFFYDAKSQKLSYTDEIGKKEFFITDDYNLNWQITNETKTIANYKVHKATTKFRGRVWEAWFAPDLAYPYGPWKLHGLPGLILEAYDTSKRYNYIALKIFKDDNNITYNTENIKKIDFKTFVLQNFEWKENILSSPITRNTRVVNYSEKRNSMELIYEWETEK